MTGSIIHARARLGACGIVAAFALALAATLMAFAAPAQAAESVSTTVYASAQKANSFVFVPQKITVSSTEAENFGYTDEVDSSKAVSQLDVLVKMHELKYGKAFTKDTATNYLALSGGFITKALGETTYNWGIAQNNKAAVDETSDYTSYGYTGLAVTQASVAKNDVVSLFYYDYIASDYSDATGISYFANSKGSAVTTVSAVTGKKVALTANELQNFMGNGSKNDADRAAATITLAKAQLTAVNTSTGKQKNISGAVTNSKGTASVSFKQPGTYLVSAAPAAGTYTASPFVFVKVSIAKGYTAKVAGAKYTVTSTNKKTVTYVKAPTGKKTVKVPATVKLKDGKTYKVTKIAAKAFKSNKTVTKVVVGKNVTKIAKSAFYKTPKLHTVQVASKHLKKAATVKASFKGSKLKKALKVTTAKGVAKKYVKKSFTKKNLVAPKNVRVA
ncbi:MAG: hypothetical protein ACOX12_02690 [Eggerthellaceae bacterium]|jgi:hypothetical protein